MSKIGIAGRRIAKGVRLIGLPVVLLAPLGTLAASICPVLAAGQYGLKEILSKEKIEPMEGKISVSLKVDRVESAEGGGWSGTLDDRWHSSDAFSGNFRDEFLAGLEYYLQKRGFTLSASPESVLVKVTIDHFEGRKRIHDDGGDLHGTLTLVRNGEVIGNKVLFESLSYRDESDERPAFEKQFGLSPVTFSTVLFYRLSLSFYRSIEAGIVDSIEGKASSRPKMTSGEQKTGGGVSTGENGQGKAGILTIESVPDDAEILLDGNLIATTPAKELRLPAGNHNLVIRRVGYQDWKREVTVLEGSNLTLKANLEKTAQ